MAEVTPGPWKVEVQHEDEADGPALEVYVCSPATVCDATVVATMGKTRWIDPATTLANAHLIVTAPEMLVMLYQYVSDLRYPPEDDSRERRIAAAEALIAKAAGSVASRARGEQA